MRSTDSRGFSLIELMMVVGIMGVLAVIAVPMSGNTIRYLKLSGDAREISNATAVAKMRAAAKFTQSRLYIDKAGKSFRIQTFTRSATTECPTVGAWCAEGGATNLSSTVSFGFGPVSTPPPNTQTTINQAAMCQTTDATPVDIANTACVIFNSRGIPVDNTGSPTGVDAVYVTDGSAVYGITVAATGFLRLWRTNSASTPTWSLQ